MQNQLMNQLINKQITNQLQNKIINDALLNKQAIVHPPTTQKKYTYEEYLRAYNIHNPSLSQLPKKAVIFELGKGSYWTTCLSGMAIQIATYQITLDDAWEFLKTPIDKRDHNRFSMMLTKKQVFNDIDPIGIVYSLAKRGNYGLVVINRNDNIKGK